MVPHHEISSRGVGDGRTRLCADEETTEVVPTSVRIVHAVEIPVQGPIRDRAQVQSGGSERSVPPPAEVTGRVPGQSDQRAAERLFVRRRDHLTVAPCAAASHRLVAGACDLVHHHRGERPLVIQDTDAGGEPGDATGGVRGAVHGVEHGEQRLLRSSSTQTGLLAQHPEAGGGEDPNRGRIRDEVGPVLSGPGAGQSPVGESAQRAGDSVDRFGKDLKKLGSVHITNRSLPTAPGRSPTLAFRMAVIDVAGYVAELKDHAVDHKFHVHDERHFVETYSLRQFWEVDLHPEEGCGGPIDLHLALEVEPRVLLDFEDAVVALPEDEDPPDKWFFPLTFNWGVPPLPKGPDLLRLAIDLAGVGGVELPLEISATDSFGSVTDAPVRRLTIVARQQVSLARVLAGEELLCDTFDRALAVTRFFLDNAPTWLDE